MKVFKYIFWVLYRVWFYILVGLPIIVLFPILLVSIAKEAWYPLFFRIARVWAKIILVGMGFAYKIDREELQIVLKATCLLLTILQWLILC